MPLYKLSHRSIDQPSTTDPHTRHPTPTPTPSLHQQALLATAGVCVNRVGPILVVHAPLGESMGGVMKRLLMAVLPHGACVRACLRACQDQRQTDRMACLEAVCFGVAAYSLRPMSLHPHDHHLTHINNPNKKTAYASKLEFVDVNRLQEWVHPDELHVDYGGNNAYVRLNRPVVCLAQPVCRSCVGGCAVCICPGREEEPGRAYARVHARAIPKTNYTKITPRQGPVRRVARREGAEAPVGGQPPPPRGQGRADGERERRQQLNLMTDLRRGFVGGVSPCAHPFEGREEEGERGHDFFGGGDFD